MGGAAREASTPTELLIGAAGRRRSVCLDADRGQKGPPLIELQRRARRGWSSMRGVDTHGAVDWLGSPRER